ncbi:helix-turn-helix domain-containing protein [Streptococcus agalactiae]|uniref:helix-turn-helix domain-containing protein n=1 Tax=Streptococcus agalactiae TaxID=1311 RepID=UPI0022EA3699|nr:helix-turn-helix domain-containing protein [Streptococcus agalactiae]
MNDNQRRGIWKLRRDGFGYGAIAQMLNMSLGLVKQYCRRHPELKGMGQFVKYQLDEGEHPYCKNCMKKLHHAVQGRPKKFCSNRCRAIWWRNHQSQHDKTKTAYDELTCQNCGESFLSYANPKRKFCGHPCYVEYRFRKGVRNDNATNHGD